MIYLKMKQKILMKAFKFKKQYVLIKVIAKISS